MISNQDQLPTYDALFPVQTTRTTADIHPPSEIEQLLLNLKQELLSKAPEYSFLQAIKILRMLGASPDISTDPADRDPAIPVRIRANLSLAFPAADIASIQEIQGDKPIYLITANFLGSYGPSSPLPTFYTEDLIEEANEGGSASRDFLDVFDHVTFTFFYHCCLKYNLPFQVYGENSPEAVERLLSLIGIGPLQIRNGMDMAFELCRYTGLILPYSHSANNLEALLRDALGGVPVSIRQCVKTVEKIPDEERAILGRANMTLGVDTIIGSEIVDRTGKFLIRIGPLKLDDYNRLLPGSPDYRKMAALTEFFLHDPLVCDVELILAENECRPACLGGPQMSRLGMDTWVFAGETIGEVSAVFPLVR